MSSLWHAMVPVPSGHPQYRCVPRITAKNESNILLANGDFASWRRLWNLANKSGFDHSKAVEYCSNHHENTPILF